MRISIVHRRRVNVAILLIATIIALALPQRVAAQVLTAIKVNSASQSVPVGATQHFTAIGTYSDATTHDLTAMATWTSSAPGFAAINAAGVAAGVAPGRTSIQASLGAVSSPPMAVTVAVLNSIDITSSSLSVPVGSRQQFTATGKYVDGTTGDITTMVTWTSSAPAFAIINPAGMTTGVAQGTTNILASVGVAGAAGYLSSAPVPVTVPVLSSVDVAATSLSVPVGSSQLFTAIGKYSDGTTHDLTATVNWASSAPAIATIIPGGRATGVAEGQSTVQAVSGAVQSQALILTVTPQQVSFSVTPRVVQPANGKLPSPISIAITVHDCDKAGVDLTTSGYTLTTTGGGLALSHTSSGKCIMTSSLTIDPTAAPGTYALVLRDGDTNVGTAEFGILDTAAGPIPPGLEPEVDVMWEVMSQDNCSDVFGKRVAQSLYCIQLKIGNNTGHPIQIAGFGFTNKLKALISIGTDSVTIANSSYASTRAVLLQSQVWSNRNLAANLLQGAGLIMGGFVPFYTGTHSPNAKLHFVTATSIVTGAALQAYNLLVPDPIISQLKSLDDQSFRDNMVIPNNSHTQTVVFVEKQAVTTALREIGIDLHDASEAAQQKLQGIAPTDANYRDSEASAKLLQKIADKSDDTIKNSTRPGFRKKKSNPLLVKMALGNVVIVGDEIEYLQRVQIQSPPAAAATTSPLTGSPSSISFGDQMVSQASNPQTVTLANTGATNLTNLNFQLSGANKSEFTVPSDKNTCLSTLAASATCSVAIVFTPDPTKGMSAARTATLDISFSPGSTPLATPLSGNAKTTPPAVVFSQTALLFGTQKAGSGQSKATLTIVNLTNASLTGLTIPALSAAAAPDFATSTDNKCANTLASGDNCTVTWTFAPIGPPGARNATVNVTYQIAGAAPANQTVNLSGTAN